MGDSEVGLVPGAKLTIKQIAEIVGVHPSTVSRALDPAKATLVREATRVRVPEAADRLGYRPDVVASGLRRGRTATLGGIVAELGNPFIAPVIRGTENNLDDRGLMALVAETQDDHDRFVRVLDHLLRTRVDAIVTTAARAGDEAVLRSVAAQIPVVLAVRNLPGRVSPRSRTTTNWVAGSPPGTFSTSVTHSSASCVAPVTCRPSSSATPGSPRPSPMPAPPSSSRTTRADPTWRKVGD